MKINNFDVKLQLNEERKFANKCECQKIFYDFSDFQEHRWKCDAYKKALVMAKAKSIEEDTNEKEQIKACPHCNEEVKAKNMNRHYIEFHKSKKNEKKQEISPPKRKVSEKKELEPIECDRCGKILSLEELDTHSASCLANLTECPFCFQRYPKEVIQEHIGICEDKRREEYRKLYDSTILMNEEKKHSNEQIQQIEELEEYWKDEENFKIEQIEYEEQRLKRDQFKRQQSQLRRQLERERRQEVRKLREQQEVLRREEEEFRRSENAEEKGLTKSKIKRLVPNEYSQKVDSKGKNVTQQCIICFVEFKKKEKIIRLPCLHVFHPVCIKNWLPLDKRCPTCKMVIKIN